MIVDVIKNAGLYAEEGTRLAAALEYLRKTDFGKLAPGRYEIDGSDVFALVQEYETRQEEGVDFEVHRKYADVQYVHEGAERIGYSHMDRLTTTVPYDEAKDCEFLSGEGDVVTLSAGMFAVVYPQDAHKPSLVIDTPARVKKVVVKVRV